MDETINIRRMTRADIGFGLVLKELAGWNQLPLDWERFQEFEPEGCFLAECDGRPAGTATTIAYENLFGWVGMVLVHPDMRRRGLGKALLLAGIEYLEKRGVQGVKLDATPMGKQLYDTIGFVDEYLVERWQGVGRVGQATDLTALTPGHLPALAAYDRPLFGADRSRVLRRLVTEPTIRAAAKIAGGQVRGYVAVRPGQNATYLGPWIAEDPDIAQELWDWALGQVAGLPVYVDIMGPNPHVSRFVEDYGFEKQRHLIRMVRGVNVSPGQPELQYGIFGPEIG